MKLAGDIVRIALTIALLWVVWKHAHWSVALCLTLIVISHEMIAWALRQHGQMLRREGTWVGTKTPKKDSLVRELWK